ncbi:MAG: hypothetical protein ACOYWZ_14790 [Bacillota bacterium]
MINHNDNDNSRIIISRLKKINGKFSELRIDKNGHLYIDGEKFDENKSSRRGVFVNIEKHRKINMGEETQRMMEERKKAEKGDTVVITDIKTPIRSEKTTVKF